MRVWKRVGIGWPNQILGIDSRAPSKFKNSVSAKLNFRDRFHYNDERENWILNRFTDRFLLAQILLSPWLSLGLETN
jgi:hypothetical protein